MQLQSFEHFVTRITCEFYTPLKRVTVTDDNDNRYRYFLLKLSAIIFPLILLPILFVVVTCNLRSYFHYLAFPGAYYTIFDDECHTQQRNMKIRKVCYRFETAESSM